MTSHWTVREQELIEMQQDRIGVLESKIGTLERRNDHLTARLKLQYQATRELRELTDRFRKERGILAKLRYFLRG